MKYNKKIILVTTSLLTLLTNNIYALEKTDKKITNDKTYNLEKVYLGKNSFLGQGIFKTFHPNETTLIPIIITTRVKNIEKTKDGDLNVTSTTKLELRPRNEKIEKLTTNIKTNIVMDKFLNTKYTVEEINSIQGITKIKCKNISPKKQKIKDFNVKIGYKSPKEIFQCDNGTKRTQEWKLVESKVRGLANIKIKRNIEIKQPNGIIVPSTEEASMTINPEGKIFEIKSTTKTKFFEIKYYSRDILQK